jgi:hypothetical protein
MAQDADIIIVRKTGSSENLMRHAAGGGYIHTMVNSRQLTVKYLVSVRRVLSDQCITASNGKPPWSRKAFVCRVHTMEHHDILSYGIIGDKFHDKHPRESTKPASITVEEAMEAIMVEVIANSHS